MDSLVVYILIAIFVLLLIIGVVLLYSKKRKERQQQQEHCEATKTSLFGGANAELKLTLNQTWTDASPLDRMTLMHYMRGKTKIDDSFVIYCKSLLAKATKDKAMYQSWFGAFIAYALAYANLPRQKDLEVMLSDIIKTYPNPRYKDGEVKNGFEVTDVMYSKLAYHVIYYEYVHKHNLAKDLYYDEKAEKELNEVLQKEVFFMKITDFKSETVTGYIYDDAFEENGIRHSTAQPSGLYNGIVMLEGLYFIFKYKHSKSLLLLVQRIFERISIAVFDDYIQLRGGELLNVITAKSDILRGLALCYEIDKSLSIGKEFSKQVASLPLAQKHFFTTINDYNHNTTHKLDKFEYYSFSEGFILLRNNSACLELVAGRYKYSRTPTTKFKESFGYLNYGLNYQLAIKNNDETIPAGQAASKGVLKPLQCTAVPLDNENTLFYVSHHTDDYICDGYYDSKLGLHTYTLEFNAEVDSYTIFNWHLNGIMNMFTINEKQFLLVTPGASFTITSSHALTGTNNVNIGSIQLKAPIAKATKYVITVKRELSAEKSSEERKPEIKRMEKFDADFSAVVPSTLKVSDFTMVTYNKQTFIIFTNNNKPYYEPKLVESITYKDKTYPIKSKSMRIYLKVD